MAGKKSMPVADLSRVTDFVSGIEDAAAKRKKNANKALLDTALIYAGLRGWEVYRKNKKRR